MSKNMVLHTFFSVTFRKQYRVSGTAVDFVFVFGSHPYTIYIVLSFFYPDPQEDLKKKKKKMLYYPCSPNGLRPLRAYPIFLLFSSAPLSEFIVD